MKTQQPRTVLDDMVNGVGRCLTKETARKLVRLRASKKAQARMEELAEKCTEGLLTPEERAEYETCVFASSFIGILQAKARLLLRGRSKAS